MAIYIDIEQIKNKLIWTEGYDNTQEEWDISKLESKFNYYLDAANNKYIEIYKRMEIAEADVKTYESDEMTETAKELVVSYSYYRFFKDNPVVFEEVDQEIKYKKIFDAFEAGLLESDITAIIPNDNDDLGYYKELA